MTVACVLKLQLGESGREPQPIGAREFYERSNGNKPYVRYLMHGLFVQAFNFNAKADSYQSRHAREIYELSNGD